MELEPGVGTARARAFGAALGFCVASCAVVVSVVGVEGGVALAYHREIAAAPDPDKRRREIEDEVAQAQSVFPRAEEFGVHELIDPRDTRPVLCDWLDDVLGVLRSTPPGRKYSLRP